MDRILSNRLKSSGEFQRAAVPHSTFRVRRLPRSGSATATALLPGRDPDPACIHRPPCLSRRSLGEGGSALLADLTPRDCAKDSPDESRATAPAIHTSLASPFTLRRQTLRVRRCSFLASHARNAAVSNASVRVIGSTLGAEEIPAVAAIPLSRRRIRRVSFFSFRPIFLPCLFAAPTATRR